MDSLPSGIFITGTDTGVGKTVVTAALARSLDQSGKSATVMKPLQTGTELPSLSDLEFVEKVTGKSYPVEGHCPYRFPQPLSPLAASKLEGREISIDKIKDAFCRLSAAHDIVLVEGAGGLLVPILESYTMADLARDLGSPLVVVARPGLGTLNHTTLTVEFAKSRGLSVLGIVINNFPVEPDLAEKTNPALLAEMTSLPILGVLENDPSLSVEKGRVGVLRESAKLGLVPALGGVFDQKKFLSQLI